MAGDRCDICEKNPCECDRWDDVGKITKPCPTCGDRESIYWMNHHHPKCKDCEHYIGEATTCDLTRIIHPPYYYCRDWSK